MLEIRQRCEVRLYSCTRAQLSDESNLRLNYGIGDSRLILRQSIGFDIQFLTYAEHSTVRT